jgi:alpha-mannosidase
MVSQLAIEPIPALQAECRSICVDDFFALGYFMLQIQVMTRRLRYTSNLDEIFLRKHVLAAADAFLAPDPVACLEALHRAFDTLGEERDHYFSTDPSLIDLTLLTPGTLCKLEIPTQPASSGDPLATPINLLIDDDLVKASGTQLTPLREAILGGQVGWAGGGPGREVRFDLLSYSASESALQDAHQRASQSLTKPQVYARLNGSTPADLTRVLASLDYQGMIAIDFVGGTGFGDESKVIRREGGAELDALTSRPLDASRDASFLAWGPRLGEMIDAGEIATGLFVHWPGQQCETFQDLRRGASWSPALGRFRQLGEYFASGERPYHHSAGASICPESADQLAADVAANQPDPISRIASATRDAVRDELANIEQGLAAVSRGLAVTEKTQVSDWGAALGATSSDSETSGSSTLIVNVASVPIRTLVNVPSEPASGEHVFAWAKESSAYAVSVDVPACGFAVVRARQDVAAGPQQTSASSMSWLNRILPRRRKRIADRTMLHNEFMEVILDAKTGGIAGVYSGQSRGNRMSLRLVHGQLETRMECEEVQVLECRSSYGSVQVTGHLLGPAQSPLARFVWRYGLARGSRLLQLSGELQPMEPLGTDPWKDYFGIRVAMASDTGNVRAIIRDKLHRTSNRRLVTPLGLVIEEGDRQTLIVSHGWPYHRRVGESFMDTLVAVSGETSRSFKVDYGFDAPHPVGVAKQAMAPTTHVTQLPLKRAFPDRGWLVSALPTDTQLMSLEIQSRGDGRLAAHVRIVKTRSSGGTTTLRFCRDVVWATVILPNELTSQPQSFWDQELTSEPTAANKRLGLTFEQDAVRVPLSGHQILDLLVVFA